jgi:hypothetical protein
MKIVYLFNLGIWSLVLFTDPSIVLFENLILDALADVAGCFFLWWGFNGYVNTIKRETVSDVLNELKQRENKGG